MADNEHSARNEADQALTICANGSTKSIDS